MNTYSSPAIQPRTDEERQSYATWLSMPDDLREQHGLPLTDLEYASRTGIGRVTLWRWRQDPEFVKHVVKHVQAYAVSEAGYVLKCWRSWLPRSHRACQGWWDSLIAPALRESGPESELAERLVQAITQSDLGRVLAAQLAAHEASRRAVDVEIVPEVEGDDRVEDDDDGDDPIPSPICTDPFPSASASASQDGATTSDTRPATDEGSVSRLVDDAGSST